MLTLKHFKKLSNMFRAYSDHLQGAHMFLVKVTSHITYAHTPNVMLPHHHIDFYIFNKF